MNCATAGGKKLSLKLSPVSGFARAPLGLAERSTKAARAVPTHVPETKSLTSRFTAAPVLVVDGTTNELGRAGDVEQHNAAS